MSISDKTAMLLLADYVVRGARSMIPYWGPLCPSVYHPQHKGTCTQSTVLQSPGSTKFFVKSIRYLPIKMYLEVPQYPLKVCHTPALVETKEFTSSIPQKLVAPHLWSLSCSSNNQPLSLSAASGKTYTVLCHSNSYERALSFMILWSHLGFASLLDILPL